MKNIWNIFLRDLKVNTREFLPLYIILVPIILAICVNLFVPSFNDNTINIAMVEGNTELEEYISDFATVEVFDSYEMLEDRINKRDNIIGIVSNIDEYYILAEGNEPSYIVDYAKALKVAYETDLNIADSNVVINEFGADLSDLKKVLVNVIILFTTVLSGMLIAINIIEEKNDKTIKALNVTTLSRNSFIFGKSLMGIFLTIFGSLSVIYITGFNDISIIQILIVCITSSIISLLIGFIQGINNDDFIGAAASIKILFLPLIGSVAAIEFLSSKWQILFYPIPFYWSYKATDEVLSNTSDLTLISIYTGIALVISIIVYLLLMPKIRKGLE